MALCAPGKFPGNFVESSHVQCLITQYSATRRAMGQHQVRSPVTVFQQWLVQGALRQNNILVYLQDKSEQDFRKTVSSAQCTEQKCKSCPCAAEVVKDEDGVVGRILVKLTALGVKCVGGRQVTFVVAGVCVLIEGPSLAKVFLHDVIALLYGTAASSKCPHKFIFVSLILLFFGALYLGHLLFTFSEHSPDMNVTAMCTWWSGVWNNENTWLKQHGRLLFCILHAFPHLVKPMDQ